MPSRRRSADDHRRLLPGLMHHGAGEHLQRHCHVQAFAAVVLAGRYDEAGDTGRHRVGPGDVIVHAAWESHLDRFDVRGAEVLVLPIGDDWARQPARAVASDVDAIARAAEHDLAEAVALLAEQMRPQPPHEGDWPEQLAEALRADPQLAIADWAARFGLHPGSVARGFAQVFGISPASYRLSQRTRRALHRLTTAAEPLGQLAAECGFADQAHMTRAVLRLAGATPGALRAGRPAHALLPRRGDAED